MGSRLPSYRLHQSSGQAIVTLRDKRTGRRRDFYLGRHGTRRSRQRYESIIARWERAGRTLPEAQPKIRSSKDITVRQITADFLDYARERYTYSEYITFRTIARMLTRVAGSEPAEWFGPLKLDQVREEMITAGWSRKHINKSISRVRMIFRRAGAREKINPDVCLRLQLLEPLRPGDPRVSESAEVRPVPIEQVEKIRPHLSRQVWAMVQVQLRTAARPGEVVGLRLRDLEMSGEVWKAQVVHHKTAHHGKTRTLYLGPQAQECVRPFITGRALDAFLFSPREAVADRAAMAETHRRPGQPQMPPKTDRRVGERYTVPSYRRAIARACSKAGITTWHPHQLRHTAATMVRAAFEDPDVAKVLLGHANTRMTDHYARADERKAIAAALQVG